MVSANAQVVPLVSYMPPSTTEWDEATQTLYIKLGRRYSNYFLSPVRFKILSIQNPYSTSKLMGFKIQTLTADKLGLI